jgi:hypothetical protein
MDDIQARLFLRACELLSLDFVRPVFGDLGVGIRMEESLRGLIRDVLLGRFDSSLAVGPYNHGSVEVDAGKVASTGFDVVASTLGSVVRDHFEYWFLYIYRTDGNPWEIYESFFSAWASRARQGAFDAIALIPDGVAVAQAFKEATTTADIRELVHRTRGEPLSSWDRRLFERRGLFSIPSNSDYFPFGDEISLCVRMTRFQQFFRRLISALQERDYKAIETAVAARLTDDPGSFVMISSLPKLQVP